MSSQNRYTDEFKRDAVAQVVDRGYPIREVAERLGVSAKSLYTWKAQFSKPGKERAAEADLSVELRRLKKELERISTGMNR
jgi:transposase